MTFHSMYANLFMMTLHTPLTWQTPSDRLGHSMTDTKERMMSTSTSSPPITTFNKRRWVLDEVMETQARRRCGLWGPEGKELATTMVVWVGVDATVGSVVEDDATKRSNKANSDISIDSDDDELPYRTHRSANGL